MEVMFNINEELYLKNELKANKESRRENAKALVTIALIYIVLLLGYELNKYELKNTFINVLLINCFIINCVLAWHTCKVYNETTKYTKVIKDIQSNYSEDAFYNNVYKPCSVEIKNLVKLYILNRNKEKFVYKLGKNLVIDIYDLDGTKVTSVKDYEIQDDNNSDIDKVIVELTSVKYIRGTKQV